MRTDQQIQKDILEELRWNPFLKSIDFEVGIKKGFVTILGTVDNYPRKLAAEEAVKGIAGVKAINSDIQVVIPQSSFKSDGELVEMALHLLKWNTILKNEKIKIKVKDGNVILEGIVEWNFERTMAKSAIENLVGMRSVVNSISLKPKVLSTNVRQRINYAFHRNAHLDSERIKVDVLGNNVTLYGKVRSIPEKDDAEKTAWCTAGVFSVENKLEIQIPQFET